MTVGYCFFMPMGGTAAPDIAGNFQQIRHMEHGDRFFPNGPGSGFQVQFFPDGNDKDEISPGRTLGYQRFEDLIRVLPQLFRHRFPVDMAVGRVIGIVPVGKPRLIQHPHDIGFVLFFCHGFTFSQFSEDVSAAP